MDPRLPVLADQLLLIERELRLLGWWAGVAPEAERLASTVPFCADTLALQEWLQWIFLPRMKAIIEQGGALPGACTIHPMGEEAWGGEGVRVAGLLARLAEFDRLISARA